MTHHQHELRDGRRLGVTGLGDPDATRLVLFCHPSPGVGGFDPDPTVTATIGVRVIVLDRPGYGGSDPMPEGDAVESWISDIDEYLRSIEANASTVSSIDFGRIGVVGWGVGALYATALAGRYPHLVEGLVLVEPTAPTRERLAAPGGSLDARLERLRPLEELDDHPGAADRMGRMLDGVALGDAAGLEFDHRALADSGWHALLGDVDASTLVISSGDTEDARWYRHRISHSRTSSAWSDPSTSIVEAWPTILEFLTPRESEAAERFSRRRGSLPFPQVSRRPR
ncbi:MAG: alpha/beta hydrolase [Acidobacteria bacterium]|nr:alpha/beta hydrolase [Acidobacteriota bacterium]